MSFSDFAKNNDASEERHGEGKAQEQAWSREAIQDWLIAHISAELSLEPATVDVHEPLASYGMDSVAAVGLSGDLEEWLGRELAPTLLYDYPTIVALASHLAGEKPLAGRDTAVGTAPGACPGTPDEPIAIIGMGCRFPGGANSPEAFWQLLRSGDDAIREIPAGRWDVDAFFDPDRTAEGKMYTRKGGFLEHIAAFDAQFFGISPHEARRMDPQQRLLLEVAWEALEDAGQSLSKIGGSSTGVFIGMMSNAEYSQLQAKVGYETGDTSYLDDPYFGTGSASSIAAGRLAYLFALQGPAMTIDTACSSSLVAVHLACQSLRNAECKLALAGGVNAMLLPEHMVNACKMGMLAADGHCKTFDTDADGFALGEGCGIIVLKRLNDAQADGDNILAIIRGSAVNQDGRSNGITAPNKLAQEAVIRKALASAGMEPRRVSYIEAHGSGTALGDPIEIDALSAALAEGHSQDAPVYVGTVKTNIGHLAGAAGIAGLMKTVLALQHRAIPPHLNLKTPNPHIRWEEKPVQIPATLLPWPSQEQTRIAGVSSFGWSGTNAHVVLEEAIPTTPISPSRPHKLLLLSAKTIEALDKATSNLQAYLRDHNDEQLADIAYTTALGRTAFQQRRFVVCRDFQDAITILETPDGQRIQTGSAQSNPGKIAFMFSGVGEQYVGMTAELYEQEATFRETIDRCAAILEPLLGLDLRELIYIKPEQDHTHLNGFSNGHSTSQGTYDLQVLLRRHGSNGHSTPTGQSSHIESTPIDRVKQTRYAQPLMFVIEYALAHLLMQWGVRPQAMIGYSLGEFVAACIAGVLSLQDALMLVARRAQLIDELPKGAMLAVALSEPDISPYLDEQVCLAAINAPTTCVLAGPPEPLHQLEQRLSRQGIAARRVETSHAFHSSMLQPLQEELTRLARQAQLHEPQIPYVSNVTGTWITPEQATDPGYWAQHMCQTVRFSDGIAQLLQQQELVLVEIGVGSALGSFVKQQVVASSSERMPQIVSTLPATYDRQSEQALLLTTLGKLWLTGVTIDWHGFYAGESRHRLALPTYPFERQRYWIEPRRRLGQARNEHSNSDDPRAMLSSLKMEELPDWFYLPGWKYAPPPESAQLSKENNRWLLFLDDHGVGRRIMQQLQEHEQEVITVIPGEGFRRLDKQTYIVHPATKGDYEALLKALRTEGKLPRRIAHLWTIFTDEAPAGTPLQKQQVEDERFATILERGFYSLLALAQAWGEQDIEGCQINVISNDMQDVTGNEQLCEEKATVIGPCKVIPQEYPHISCRSIDMTLPEPGSWQEEELLQLLTTELLAAPEQTVIALRGNRRWIQSFEPVRLLDEQARQTRLREGGVYLITGGLGGIGLAMAEYLARTVRARLILTARKGLPQRSEWTSILEARGDTEGVGRQIRKVQELEALGAEALVMQADVADEAQMQAVIRQAISSFGAIHGVLHAAGVPGVGLMQLKTAAQAAQVLAPKVLGTRVLERVLQGLSLDFLVLFSSITSITGGGPGQVDYCAANAFLDAYAHRHFAQNGMTVAINWGEWQWNAWEAGLSGYDSEAQAFFRENRRRFGIDFERGTEALRRVLSRRFPQVIVSTQDFRALVELSRSYTAATMLQNTRKQQETRELHPRPVLASEYAAPRNDLERRIASVWMELLGVAEIGIDDNFFELGGNSLVGIDLIGRLRKALQIESLPSYVLYEAPTVGAMAQYVEQNKTGEVVEDRYERGERRRENLKQRMMTGARRAR
jgi:acyl transferase domain-containing protein/acyl carrier protein